MKGLLLGMMLTYGGLVYTGKVAAPKLPDLPFPALAQAQTPKRAPAAASTLSVIAAVPVGNDTVVKVLDSANNVVCYGALGANQQVTSLYCLK